MFCTIAPVSLGSSVCSCETWTITCFAFTGSEAGGQQETEIDEYLKSTKAGSKKKKKERKKTPDVHYSLDLTADFRYFKFISS